MFERSYTEKHFFRKMKKRTFVESYRKGGSIVEVCRKLGMSSATVHSWKMSDPDFRKAVNEIAQQRKDQKIKGIFEL